MTTSLVSRCLVERLLDSGNHFSIICAGAGGSAAAALMSVPGCSNALVEAQFPYHHCISTQLLDYRPRSFVSSPVAVSFAQAAFNRCEAVLNTSQSIIGIGGSAALSTNRQRRGRNSAFISSWSSSGLTNYHVSFGTIDRARQESIVTNTILVALASAAMVKHDDLDLMLPPMITEVADSDNDVDVRICRSFTPQSKHPLDALLDGEVESVCYNRNGSAKVSGLPPYVAEDVAPELTHNLLYPGSFNPLHWGHTELARTASTVVQRALDSSTTKRPVSITYEVAISRVGKQDLSRQDLYEHVQQFTSQGHRVAVTTAKLFVDKARLFPHHGLVVGIDTVVRVLDPQYYGNSRTAMIDAMKFIRSHKCYFVVGGRLRGETWVDLNGVHIPEEVRDMFIPIPKELFRVDISSTEIRKRRQQ